MPVPTKLLPLLAIIFLFLGGGLPANERPNILVILTDDMGFSDLGCFGGEIETPSLDSLAAGGLRFTEFYNTARCWPTRATLLSGRYANGLSENQVTIPEILKENGYQTGMVGKWHLGTDPEKDGPIQRGFDRFYGTLAGANSYWDPETLTRNTTSIEATEEDYYYTDQIGEEAGKTVAVGDVYEVPMGGPLTFGSVGHNWANAQNTPMRRYKANVHNGGACTPAIMHWPAGITAQPGSLSPGRGHVVDLMATSLELAGATYPESLEGNPVLPHESRSLVPLLTGGPGDRDHPHLFNHSNTHAVVKGDWKIVREGNGDWALYHLASERTEITNLAREHPEVVARLAKIWKARWGAE